MGASKTLGFIREICGCLRPDNFTEISPLVDFLRILRTTFSFHSFESVKNGCGMNEKLNGPGKCAPNKVGTLKLIVSAVILAAQGKRALDIGK